MARVNYEGFWAMVSKIVSPEAAAARIADGAVVTVSSSSGLGCPDRMLAAIGARFEAEIVGVPVGSGEVTVDEGPRPETTLEGLARLRPVVAGGQVVTAGNSSALNDGASAIVVASGVYIWWRERPGRRRR